MRKSLLVCCVCSLMLVLTGCSGDDESIGQGEDAGETEDVGQTEDVGETEDVGQDSGSEASCDDGERSGQQTDVDCGGPDCEPCQPGAGCKEADDCTSEVCDDNTCRAPSCDDGVQNGDQTDVDCGGSECDPCALGRDCEEDEDCDSDQCEDGTCSAPEPFVFTADDNAMRAVGAEGSSLWDVSSPGDRAMVATDPEGHLYGAGSGVVYKFDRFGDEIWAYDDFYDDDDSPGPSFSGMAVTDDGAVYVTGQMDTMWRIDADGQNATETSVGTGITYTYCVAADLAGHAYVGTNDGTVLEYDSDGDLQATHEVADDIVRDVVVDDGYLYVASNDETVRKYDGDDQQWIFDEVDEEPFELAVDAEGNVLVAADVVHHLDVDGESQWELEFDDELDGDPEAVAFGADGHVYVGNGTVSFGTGDRSIQKFDVDQQEVWNYTAMGTPSSLAVEPGVAGTFPDAWDDD